MKNRVKHYVENCVDIARISIKIHKKYGTFSNRFWLDDAEKYVEAASMAIEYDMLPSELKEEGK